MNITEAKLKEIILQEVQLRLVEYYIDQEIDALIAEDEDWDAAKWKARKAKARNIALGALGMGVGVGGLKMATDQHADTKAADTEKVVSQRMADAATDEAQFTQLTKQLNNQYAFRWGKGNNSVVYAPGSKGKITVLPPSYSIQVKVLQDKKMNADRMEQGLKPIERYGEIDLEKSVDSDRQYQGDYESNIDNFFKTHKGNFVNALDVVGSHDELDTVPASGMEEMIVMVNPDKISGDYYLPELGMSAADFYNQEYGEYMGSGEMAALDAPDEEMVVTPDDGTEVNPELIRKTKARADKVRESRITWKNYKNRKKILA